ncbi:hypothetical protein V2O64_18710 [Verrucomicrobiaceae bacterium 227]
MLLTIPRHALKALLLAGLLPSLQAAVIAAPDLVSTLISVSDGSTVDKDSSPLVDFKDLINGNDRGDVISAASGLELLIPGPENFAVSAASLSSNTSRGNAGGPVESSSLSQYEISFELAGAETGELSLQFSYALQDLGVASSISWSLVGPSGAIAALSGTRNAVSGQSAQQTGAVNQATVLTQGSYTFTIKTLQATQTLQNQKSGLAEITDFTFNYSKDTSIPEPSTALLSLLVIPALLRRRRSVRA